MSRKLHILIITPGFPKDEKDSTCIPALQDFMETSLSINDQIKFTVISIQYPVSSVYNWHGVEVIPMSGNNAKGFKKYRTWLKTKRAAQNIIKSENVDLIHAFWATEAAYIAHKVSKKANIPYLVTAMGQDVLATPSYLAHVELQNLVYVSEFQKLQSSFHAKNSSIIEWGVKPINTVSTRSIDIVGVGSLIEVKDWERFIRIAAKLKSIQSGLRVQLIGEGPLRADLEKLNDSLDKAVEFMGELPREQSLKSIAAAKVVLHTARYESFCMVLAEGLSAGCKVISSDVGIAYSNKLIEVYSTDNEAVNLIIDALGVDNNDNHQFPEAKDCATKYADLYYSLV